MAFYLVTGGAGFIGSHIVHSLVTRGQQVRVLDNFATGHKHNLSPVADKIEVINGDVRDYCTLRQAVDGVDFVLHQAALPSVPRSIRDPLGTNEVNVLGTLNLLHAAQEEKVKRFVFASSSSVYGNSAYLPKHERLCPSPLSPYAISKLAGEQYCQVFFRLYGLETVCLRYFNVFGPHQDPASQYAAVIPRFIRAILNNEPLTIFGDGSQSRDFTFVENIVEANWLASRVDNVGGKVFNIASGERHSLLKLVTAISELTGCNADVYHAQPRPGDVPHSQADISAARYMLGYKPTVDFYSGLHQVVEWFLEDQGEYHKHQPILRN